MNTTLDSGNASLTRVIIIMWESTRITSFYEIVYRLMELTRTDSHSEEQEDSHAFVSVTHDTFYYSLFSEQMTTQPAPTTTTPPLTNCYNNGTLLNVVNQGPTCFCSELFTGRQCDKVNCMNAGFPDPDGNVCACAAGYHGTNCQDGLWQKSEKSLNSTIPVTCPLNWEPFLTDYKTLVVVIRNTNSMNTYLSSISQAIYKEVNCKLLLTHPSLIISAHQQWYQQLRSLQGLCSCQVRKRGVHKHILPSLRSNQVPHRYQRPSYSWRTVFWCHFWCYC